MKALTVSIEVEAVVKKMAGKLPGITPEAPELLAEWGTFSTSEKKLADIGPCANTKIAPS